MEFKPVDFSIYNKPPFYPQYLSRGETKKLVSYDDAQLAELDLLIDKMSDQYDLEKAKGILLDRIGKLKDEPRNGNGDELYRLMIRLRILLDTTEGSVNDIIKLIKFLYTSEVVHIEPDYPAGITILHDGEGPPIDFNSIIVQAVVAGVSYNTKELFFFSDEVLMTELVRIRVRRLDNDFFGLPIKYNAAIKYDGCTVNPTIKATGKYDGIFTHGGGLKYNGLGDLAAQYKPVPPFKYSSGIVDKLDVVFGEGDFSETHDISETVMNMTISRNHSDAEVIVESHDVAVIADIEEDTKKDIKHNRTIKYNGKYFYSKDYVDKIAMITPGNNASDKAEMSEDSFYGMRKHHFFNGMNAYGGAIKYDGMALIPLG